MAWVAIASNWCSKVVRYEGALEEVLHRSRRAVDKGNFSHIIFSMSTSNIHPSDTVVRKDASGKRRSKVLIVDDEPAIREVLEMILQEWGYDVRLASDGAEAKQLVESYDPEVVISDVVMTQLFGLDLLRCLKAGN